MPIFLALCCDHNIVELDSEKGSSMSKEVAAKFENFSVAPPYHSEPLIDGQYAICCEYRYIVFSYTCIYYIYNELLMMTLKLPLRYACSIASSPLLCARTI